MQGRLGLRVAKQGRLGVGLKWRLGVGIALKKREGQRVDLGAAVEVRLWVAYQGGEGLCEVLQRSAGLVIALYTTGLTKVQQGAWLPFFLQGREGLTVSRCAIPDSLQWLGNDRVERHGNIPVSLGHWLGKAVGEGRVGLGGFVARSLLMKAVSNQPERLAQQWVRQLLMLVGRLLGALVPALSRRAAGLPPAGRIVVPALLLPLQPAPTGGRRHALAATGGGNPRHCRSHAERSAPER